MGIHIAGPQQRHSVMCAAFGKGMAPSMVTLLVLATPSETWSAKHGGRKECCPG